MVEQRPTPEIPPGLYVRSSGGNLRRAWKPTPTQTLNMRYAIYERDNYTCQICGKVYSRAKHSALTLDHILPYKYGGQFTEENLRAACGSCNSSRGARLD